MRWTVLCLLASISSCLPLNSLGGVIETSAYRNIDAFARAEGVADDPVEIEDDSLSGPFDEDLTAEATSGGNSAMSTASHHSTLQNAWYSGTLSSISNAVGDGSSYANANTEVKYAVLFHVDEPVDLQVSATIEGTREGSGGSGSAFFAIFNFTTGIHPVVAQEFNGTTVVDQLVNLQPGNDYGLDIFASVTASQDFNGGETTATADVTFEVIQVGLVTPTVTTSYPPTPSPTWTNSPTATLVITPSATTTPALTATVPTGTPSVTTTPTLSPSATATAVASLTATTTATAVLTATPTLTPALIELSLDMGATAFGQGDTCYLDLHVENSGSEQTVDLYVLLDVMGEYWFYPSWQPLSRGLDFETRTVPAQADEVWELIPQFQMPPVAPFGPLYFYAAMFEQGTLSLDTIVSSAAVWEFYLE